MSDKVKPDATLEQPRVVKIDIELHNDAPKTSIYVFEFIAVFPLSIETVIVVDIAFAGTVNLYHTSFVIPHVLILMSSLEARYKSPLIVEQVVFGVNVVALLHKSLPGAANKNAGKLIKAKTVIKARR